MGWVDGRADARLRNPLGLFSHAAGFEYTRSNEQALYERIVNLIDS